MSFSKIYLAATRAFDAKQYVEAIQNYLHLLEHERERLWMTIDQSDAAKLVHIRLAIQYALHKAMIRRLLGHASVSIDLSMFMRGLPVQIMYGKQTSVFLHGWKDGSSDFDEHLIQAQEIYASIQQGHLGSVAAPDIVHSDVYATHWIVPDLIELEPYLPKTLRGFVSLGCGGGIFESTYLPCVSNLGPSTLIDIDPSAKPSVDEGIELRGLANTMFQQSFVKQSSSPDFVLSIRSCGYLYSAKEYDDLFVSLKPGSRVLLDVAPSRFTETKAYFDSLGAQLYEHERSGGNHELKEFVFS